MFQFKLTQNSIKKPKYCNLTLDATCLNTLAFLFFPSYQHFSAELKTLDFDLLLGADLLELINSYLGLVKIVAIFTRWVSESQ